MFTRILSVVMTLVLGISSMLMWTVSADAKEEDQSMTRKQAIECRESFDQALRTTSRLIPLLSTNIEIPMDKLEALDSKPQVSTFTEEAIEEEIVEPILLSANPKDRCYTASSTTSIGQIRKERVIALIDRVCEDMDFNLPELIKGMVQCESDFNRFCVGADGEHGLTQITPRYYRELMEKYGCTSDEDLFDEETNLRIGIDNIRSLIETHGDVGRALVVYNCGLKGSAGRTSNGYSERVLSLAGEYA